MDFVPEQSMELPECFCEKPEYTTGLDEASFVVRAVRKARLKRHQRLYEDKFLHDLYKIGVRPYSVAPFFEVPTAEVTPPEFDYTQEEKEQIIAGFIEAMSKSNKDARTNEGRSGEF